MTPNSPPSYTFLEPIPPPLLSHALNHLATPVSSPSQDTQIPNDHTANQDPTQTVVAEQPPEPVNTDHLTNTSSAPSP